jgi:hypothetical protein
MTGTFTSGNPGIRDSDGDLTSRLMWIEFSCCLDAFGFASTEDNLDNFEFEQ